MTVVSSCKPAKHECYTLVKLVTLLHYGFHMIAIYCRPFHIIIISFLSLYSLHKELTNATPYSRKEILCNHKSTWICRLFLNYCYESSLILFPRWNKYTLNLLCVWCIGGKRQASFVVSLYCQARSPENHENFTFLRKPIVYGAARLLYGVG